MAEFAPSSQNKGKISISLLFSESVKTFGRQMSYFGRVEAGLLACYRQWQFVARALDKMKLNVWAQTSFYLILIVSMGQGDEIMSHIFI